MKLNPIALVFLFPCVLSADPTLVRWSDSGEFVVRGDEIGLPGFQFRDPDDPTGPRLSRGSDDPNLVEGLKVEGTRLLVSVPSDGVWFLTFDDVGKFESRRGVVGHLSIVLIRDSARTAPPGLHEAWDLFRHYRLGDAADRVNSISSLWNGVGPASLNRLADALRAQEPFAAFFRDADSSFQRGEYLDALQTYKLLTDHPLGVADAKAGAGEALLCLGRPGEAEKVLGESLEIKPAADVAFNLGIARYSQKKWAAAWSACSLCLKWSEKGSRLQERAAEIGYAIARRLEERLDREAAYREIVAWAPETDGGREAAEELE